MYTLRTEYTDMYGIEHHVLLKKYKKKMCDGSTDKPRVPSSHKIPRRICHITCGLLMAYWKLLAIQNLSKTVR
jgi:hypothetical protein